MHTVNLKNPRKAKGQLARLAGYNEMIMEFKKIYNQKEEKNECK